MPSPAHIGNVSGKSNPNGVNNCESDNASAKTIQASVEALLGDANDSRGPEVSRDTTVEANLFADYLRSLRLRRRGTSYGPTLLFDPERKIESVHICSPPEELAKK